MLALIQNGVFLTRYSLYTIFFFWVCMLAIMALISPEFFGSYNYVQKDSSDISSKIPESAPLVEYLFTGYEQVSSFFSSIIWQIMQFPAAFADNDSTGNTGLNILVLSIPYVLSFFMLLMALNSISPERLIIGSIINSSKNLFIKPLY